MIREGELIREGRRKEIFPTKAEVSQNFRQCKFVNGFFGILISKSGEISPGKPKWRRPLERFLNCQKVSSLTCFFYWRKFQQNSLTHFQGKFFWKISHRKQILLISEQNSINFWPNGKNCTFLIKMAMILCHFWPHCAKFDQLFLRIWTKYNNLTKKIKN